MSAGEDTNARNPPQHASEAIIAGDRFDRGRWLIARDRNGDAPGVPAPSLSGTRQARSVASASAPASPEIGEEQVPHQPRPQTCSAIHTVLPSRPSVMRVTLQVGHRLSPCARSKLLDSSIAVVAAGGFAASAGRPGEEAGQALSGLLFVGGPHLAGRTSGSVPSGAAPASPDGAAFSILQLTSRVWPSLSPGLPCVVGRGARRGRRG
jgi:hypothetical protein